MKKLLINCPLILFVLCTLTGCGSIGAKSTPVSIIYGVTAILSFCLLIAYCYFIYQKDTWFLLLFSSVFIVNAGYFCLSISTSLNEALLANRISYLGSVFLPMAMLFIIMDTVNLCLPKWFSLVLLSIALAVFFIAASPGYSTIYYKEVSLQTVNGLTFLDKVYGPWHCIYLFYLLAYFIIMAYIVVRAVMKKKLASATHSIIFLIAVFINMGVWLIEQLISVNFEMLSISYIITELFLLVLNIVIIENEIPKTSTTPQLDSDSIMKSSLPQQDSSADTISDTSPLHESLIANLTKLTKTERMIFDFYLSGLSTKEILAELSITENTLKFHNKNIYGKLNVSSRRQLLEIYNQIHKK